MTELFNKEASKQTRRSLRRNSPITEYTLWSKIRNRQLGNIKFKRQFSIGKYIVDFYSSEKLLAIEIDGESHYTKQAVIYDKEREYYINQLGIRIIRFTNEEILNNLEGVLLRMLQEIDDKQTSPQPSPS